VRVTASLQVEARAGSCRICVRFFSHFVSGERVRAGGVRAHRRNGLIQEGLLAEILVTFVVTFFLNCL
jgi:hypothetical protein